jgi:multidrug efflux pump subunit AcrA (membrane-fusion protein)
LQYGNNWMKNSGLMLKLLPLLILLVAAGAYAYMKASKPERVRPEPREKVWQVETITAEPRSLAPQLTLYGKVETSSLLNAAAPGAGEVAEVRVKPGDKVIKGQILLVMDSRDFAAANLQAQADVADIEAQLAEHDLRYQANQRTLTEEKALLELTRKELKRIQRLNQNNLSSESALSDAREVLGKQELSVIQKQLEVDRYQTTRKQLRARLSRARAQLAVTELAIARSEIVAPFDGVVSAVQVAAGDRVRISDLLLSLYALDSLEIRGRVPAAYQGEIGRALEDGKSLRAQAELAGDSLQLELVRLAGAADPSGIDAYFRVVDGSQRLRIGNLVSIGLERPQQAGLVKVPFSAIYGNDRIFLLRDGRMSALSVESVGQLEDSGGQSWLLVRSPSIQSGDEIIATHLPNAVDGLKVKKAGVE